MRKDSTDAENRLWSILRSRKLCGHKFRRQYPVGGFILDFYCVKSKLGVEADGGQHAEPEGELADQLRTERLNALGVRVIRFSDVDILKDTDAVIAEILRRLETTALPSPLPSPGVPGEGVGFPEE
jgi:very-short-patch-repair endonuclease